ncbi:MAG: hypothetical protein JO078_05620 [Candidatus Eremiobacteraeota bacterium]|nr:hypothetical protein [Candidatus Eremiobacteraeota bacterium]MBV9056327.1 hypothetical protein [Candidatus Eremiobacteraeota bacterium]MBV9699587.1 hypothetical protein [Candidatus Eremiobacteraeota bacterium]
MRLSIFRAAAIALAVTVPAACGSSTIGSLPAGSTMPRTQWDRLTPAGVTVKQFKIPLNGVQPSDVALGQGGNLYVSQPVGVPKTYLWQVTEAGKIASAGSTGYTGPVGITGSKGAVYFGLQQSSNHESLGIYYSGKLTFKRLNGPPVNAIYYLKKAKDGSIWFSDPGDYQVGHIVKGSFTTLRAPTKYCSPYGITIGSDQNVWVAEQCATTTSRIGRITAKGQWTEFVLPKNQKTSQGDGITAGPDGNLWFTLGTPNDIGRITTAGKIKEFALGSSDGPGYAITVGNDKALWYTLQQSGQIGRMTTKGSYTAYAVPAGGSAGLTGISAGAGRTIWFTETNSGQVGRLTY